MITEGFRALDASVHDLDDRTHTVVVHIPHERLDTYRTDFARDAFADSFRSRLPVMLREHDPRDRIGHATGAQSLATVNEIRGQFEPFEANPTARRTFDDLRSGKLKGWSFFFRGARTVPHPTVRGATRYLLAEMPEFSAVARPSVPGTVTVALRSMVTSEHDDLLAELACAFDCYEMDALERRRLSDPAFRSQEITAEIHRLAERVQREATWRSHRRSAQHSSPRGQLIQGALERIDSRGTGRKAGTR